MTPVANLPPVSTTPAAKLPPVSTTPAANFATSFASLPPVSMTLVANNGNNIRLLSPQLKGKIYLYVNSTTQTCPNKILIEDFSRLPPLSTVNGTGVYLGLQISPQIFEKIRNSPNGILRGFGETDSWKKPEDENLVALSFSTNKDHLTEQRESI
jgi:hypothetical protein